MFKRFVGVLLFSLTTILLFAGQVSAAVEVDLSFDSNEGFEDPETGEWIQPFRFLEDGSVELISEEEYMEALSPTTYDNTDNLITPLESIENIIEPNSYYYWRFDRSGTRTRITRPRVKASPDINCTTSTCSTSLSVGASTSHAFSTSVGAERTAIRAGAGYTWTSSASSKTTFSYNIRRGDRGYIAFSPYHWRVSGTLKYIGSRGIGVIDSKSAWGSYPKKLSNGQADGIYAFVYTRRG